MSNNSFLVIVLGRMLVVPPSFGDRETSGLHYGGILFFF